MPPGIGYNRSGGGFNPNFGLAGLAPQVAQPGMNRNPTGAGGALGAFQPQLSALGAFNNSTQFRPNQYSAFNSPINQAIEEAGIVLPEFPSGQFGRANRYDALTHGVTQGMLGSTGPASLSLEAQILAAQRRMLEQARDARPTSGTYFFTGMI